MRTFVRASSLLIALSPAVALADSGGKLDASFALGGHFFADNGALGAGSRMDDPGPLSSGLIGGRIGYAATKRIAAEAELMVIPTEDDVVGDYATVFGLRTHARVDLMTGKFRPFLGGGVGLLVLRGNTPLLINDTQAELHWGGGVRYAISSRFDLRVDVRHLIVADRTADGVTSDVEATAGFAIRFGGKPTPRARAVEPAPSRVVDTDHDGIPDNVDRCPTVPEDFDNFEDADGCPELDNDKDGIADTKDACPNEPETFNGYKDADGCPDEMLSEIAGIGFEIDSARIDTASASVLDAAYRILVENPRLRIQISGHTSSEGDPANNKEMSRRSAVAVKQFLVSKGVAANRIEAIGFGASKPVAANDDERGRAKNRRIEFRVLAPTALR